ncbi:hypothetical protein J2772_003815 [Chryseobacterium jejuense]|nr:hypothetical protein [Chryseobacterium jejuense]
MILAVIGFLAWFLYIYKFVYIGPPKEVMLKNTKYTIGKVTSEYYNAKPNGYGYDYRFKYGSEVRKGHRNGEFKLGGRYLVAYDSTNIKNGYVILDKFDVTDSLVKYHIEQEYGDYPQGWSLEKIPFQYDKSDIEYEVRIYVMSKQ